VLVYLVVSVPARVFQIAPVFCRFFSLVVSGKSEVFRAGGNSLVTTDKS